MITVLEAEQIILSHRKDYGVETVPFLEATGRVLAENVAADRDLPPYDRVTMDGIAIRFSDYESGHRNFRIAATQAAGDAPVLHLDAGCCLEIMTGAACSGDADTVIPYEKIQIDNGIAWVSEEPPTHGQNIHRQGHDRRMGEVVMAAGCRMGPAHISMAASVGKSFLQVKKRPRVVIVSSGDELVEVNETPLPYQIRRSNNYAIHAVLNRHYGIDAKMMHLPDNEAVISREIARFQMDFDVIILSGGVSMGKFDFIPQALETNGVRMQFHKVRQRPGKPFWFGTFGEKGVVFALPGNPVSTFMCFHRYVLPWLETSIGFPAVPPQYAVLGKTVRFEPALTYYIQVKLYHGADARLQAVPVEGHGSGDFANLLDADAFLELPMEQSEFPEGAVFRIFPFRNI